MQTKKRPDTIRQAAEDHIHLLATGHLDLKIGKRFALDEASEAHTLIESSQRIGKILLKVH